MDITRDVQQTLEPVAIDDSRTDFNFALPAVQYSDRHLDGIVKHNLSFTSTKLLFHCLGNMDSKTGIIHSYTVAELAARFGVQPCNFYGESGYIAILNKTGMVKLEIKYHRVVGRVVETPHRRKRKKKLPRPYQLDVGVLHRDYLKVLFSETRKNSVLRMFLIMGLHVDKVSGAINTMFRPVEWGQKIGNYAAINCDRAVDFLIDSGLLDGVRRYVVEGKLQAVAMGEAFLFLSNEKSKEAAKQEKQRGSLASDYRQIEVDLLNFFGLNASGWTRLQLSRAKERLLFFMKEEGKKSLAELEENLSGTGTQSAGAVLGGLQ